MAYAVKMAKLKEDKYGVAIYPKYQPDVWDLLRSQGLDSFTKQIAEISGESPESILIREASRILQRTPVQARMQPLCLRLQ